MQDLANPPKDELKMTGGAGKGSTDQRNNEVSIPGASLGQERRNQREHRHDGEL